MQIRKIATTVALCAAGMSVLGAGSALAEGWHNEIWGTNLTEQDCHARMNEAIKNPNVGGAICEDGNHDGKYELTVSVRN
ncbi:hypothetical protein ABT337_09910 [Saccharopolyspora hirsuta]|uniref:Secreted protein n=1 Tax=Saccharopolyspora hirsuta TaxID=1837 RepID=A0A5M7BUQ9_SACHI|nr:hypothetical protein [Saccharopolyspora hirsuta]KAA5830105.1 hypothetical protein F1721_23695 [Saccharopolyspora hirsuta]MBF6507446.1 hypothetical protein [Nocardia farcinica]